MKYLTRLTVVYVFFAMSQLWAETLLVVINPNAAKGTALSYYQDHVQKKLRGKNIELIEIIERDPIMAQERIKTAVVTNKNLAGIIGIGGDGTIYQIYQVMDKWAPTSLEKIPVGHIPLGSGNALSRSIYHQACGNNGVYSADAMIDGIVLRHSLPALKIDLWSYNTDRNQHGIFFLGLSYGVISDIDIESEMLRSLGAYRFDVMGALRGVLNKSYHAQLDLKSPIPGNSSGILTTHLTGLFRQIWIMNMPYASEKVLVAPHAQLNDGILSVLVAQEPSWSSLWQFLMAIGPTGFAHLPFVNIHQAHGASLYAQKGERITVDGDLLDITTTRVDIHPYKTGRVFTAKCRD